jgi:hypothetical protein
MGIVAGTNAGTFRVESTKRFEIQSQIRSQLESGGGTVPQKAGKDDAPVPAFSDIAWIRELVRQWLISQVARYEQEEARKAIEIKPDNTLIS